MSRLPDRLPTVPVGGPADGYIEMIPTGPTMDDDQMTYDDEEIGGDAGPRRPRLHIFCDFDGTISTVDIGFDFFDRFGVQEPWHERLLAGELGTREYWRIMADNLREPVSAAMLDRYLSTIPVDPGLGDLLDLVHTEKIPFTLVSDGFDLYIERYLAMQGVDGVEIFSNRAALTEDGRLALSFPFAAEGCTCSSAACKRNVVLLGAGPDERIIYIGDGVSDFCPAGHADIIFAKKRLAAYCNAERLPHYPFKTLSDVARQLRLLLAKKRIRPRHQAVLKRKSAWEEE
jgi:2,3-diketo-5-methylthio-1-phosphopentane phosphatase